MSKKLLFILGGAVVLTLVALGILVYWQRGKPLANTNNSNTNAVLPNVNTVVANVNQNQNLNQPPLDPNINDKTAVQQIGRSFASIYASFSTQNDFENITDLYFYMTPELKSQQESFVAAERTKRRTDILYHGITSEARIVELSEFDASQGSATVKVTLQRVESTGTTSNSETYYQDLTLSLVKQSGVWKVGKIVWGQKQ
ncbi:hypothetical protein C4546_00660 [Candidatus Parcubacteria bacterium]|jgi:hypothetical protein|nr:MAG: hypothetical protein C4546_00660 [Candidatus Parcubacteria bacterium]